MNKLLYITLFLLLIAALLFWHYRSATRLTDNKKLSKAPATAVVVPAREPLEQQTAEKNVLNLALPKTPLLVDPVITLPAERHNLKNIFTQNDDKPVSIGARLLMDENPKPNAGVLDTVTGAEVGITIKTP